MSLLPDTPSSEESHRTCFSLITKISRLVSLMDTPRSMSMKLCSWLRCVDNRVCVALSRAKHALYCIGNFSQLCSKSGLWQKIMTYVHSVKKVGDGVLLQCQKHPKYEQVFIDKHIFHCILLNECGFYLLQEIACEVRYALSDKWASTLFLL